MELILRQFVNARSAESVAIPRDTLIRISADKIFDE